MTGQFEYEQFLKGLAMRNSIQPYTDGIYVGDDNIRSTPMNKTITLDRDYFEHLLNCLANQKFIHDVNADGLSEGKDTVKQMQSEAQKAIDTTWRKGMDLLYATQSEVVAQSDLIEQLSACEHLSWSHWMIYLFSKCEFCEDGSYSIPAGLAAHWKRQATTAYENLSEREKQSDRDEVAKILPIIEAYRTHS